MPYELIKTEKNTRSFNQRFLQKSQKREKTLLKIINY